MIVEINAKQFINWLFTLPIKKLVKPMRASDVIAVARRLAELADSNPEMAPLRSLAQDVLAQLIRIPEVQVASNERCLRFLDDFAPYFLGHDLTNARAAIKSTAEVGGRRIRRNPNRLEYRVEKPILFAPSVTYGPKRSRRPRADDLSERIGAAIDAMIEAKCTRPVACVADALKKSGLVPQEYCSTTHVLSRSKSLGKRVPFAQQDVPTWPYCYWLTLHENASKTVADPEWSGTFAFLKCDC